MTPDPSFPDRILERARVVRLSADTAWVQCESQSGCARCAAGEGCGAGLFAKLLRGRLQELPLRVPPGFGDLAPGDPVLIGLSVSAVQNAAFLLYGLPLAGLLLGTVAAGLLLPGDAFAFAGAMSGLAGGLWLARRGSKHLSGNSRLQAVLLRPIAAGEPCSVGREG